MLVCLIIWNERHVKVFRKKPTYTIYYILKLIQDEAKFWVTIGLAT